MAPQSAPTVRPIASRSVTELVTAELRRSILSGALAPGQSFSLREIAGLLNVSFIPVREALRNLEADGLVVIQPGRSATVPRSPWRTLRPTTGCGGCSSPTSRAVPAC